MCETESATPGAQSQGEGNVGQPAPEQENLQNKQGGDEESKGSEEQAGQDAHGQEAPPDAPAGTDVPPTD